MTERPPTDKERLENLLIGTDVIRSEASAGSDQASYWIDADGPVNFELLHDGEVSISSLIYLITEPADEIIWGAIADFNATHLHDGGYRLFLDGNMAVVVSQKQTLAQLEATGLDAYLEDFVSRCGSCSCWYMEQIDAAHASR